MVFKAYLPDGRIVCSSCKSEVKQKDNRCEVCLSLLEVEKEGIECPYCGKVVDRYATICEYCGKVLRETRTKDSTAVDEEFLLKLLDLGKKVEKETPEDIEERTKALEVIKAVAGVVDETTQHAEKVEKPRDTKLEVEKELEKEQEVEVKSIVIPDELRKQFSKILETDIAKLKEKIDTLPQGTLKDALATFIETISSVAETKIGGQIEKDKFLVEIVSLLNENIECINSVIDQYLDFTKMQTAMEETISKATQTSGGKISKKDWLAAQKQVQAELFKVKKELDEETEKRVKKATKKAEEEIEKLKSQIAELTTENEKLKKMAVTDEEIEELRTMLKTLDDLLGELPDNKIEEFAKSEKFKLYEKILDKYKVGED
ncbi:MAG: zinc ribbon domain-containing protein [Thermoplasmata archaeon]